MPRAFVEAFPICIYVTTTIGLTFDDDTEGKRNFHLSARDACACALAVDIMVVVDGVDNFIRFVRLSNCDISLVLSFGSQINEVVAIYVCIYMYIYALKIKNK